MIQFTENNYKEAHKFSTKNGDQLKNDKICGCFYCLKIFAPAEIENWLSEKKRIVNDQSVDWITDDHLTALCPHCGVDSVIGESSGYPITMEFLEEMKKHWFSVNSKQENME